MQDATPLTLGQGMVRFVGMLANNVQRVKGTLEGVYQLALGGTVAVSLSKIGNDIRLP